MDNISRFLFNTALRRIQITGTSMEPVINDGDTVNVCSTLYYEPGDIIVFLYKGSLLIHRLLKIEDGIYYAKGDNSFRIEDFNEDSIVGKVLLPYDYNHFPDFINASLHIGNLFKKNRYSIESTKNTQDYCFYKSSFLEGTKAKTTFFEIRNSVFYSLLPSALDNYPYAIIKGEPLSSLAYGKCGSRIHQDIDILISKTEIDDIEKILKDEGFKKCEKYRYESVFATITSHQVVPFSKEVEPFGKMTIDINFDVFWGEYDGKRADIDLLLSDYRYIDVFGHRFKTLSPVNSLIQLCLHHYKDMNSLFIISKGKTNYQSLLQDVYCLLINNLKEINVEKLSLACFRNHSFPYVYYILYYCYYIYRDPLLKPYLNALKTPEGEEILLCYGLNNQERKKWKVSFDFRLKNNDLFSIIRADLNELEIKKIEANLSVFS